jgi:hypothetical protein
VGGGELTERTQTIKTAFFGFLLTIYRERWEDSKRYALLRVAIEHLQVLMVLLQPQFLWRINYGSWAWKLADYIMIKGITKPLVRSIYLTEHFAPALSACN